MQATYLAGLLGATTLGITVGIGVSSQPLQESQDEAAPAAGTQEAAADEIDPMMAAMKRAGEIGDNHALLAAMVGEFDAKTTFVTEGEMETGTATWIGEWAMGGRFLEGTFQMDWMGTPFIGQQTIGYSNLEQTFESTWVDNSSTNLHYSGGFASEDGKQITFLGAEPNVLTGEIEETEAVLEFIDENSFSYTNYPVSDGQRGEMDMKIEYTRR